MAQKFCHEKWTLEKNVIEAISAYVKLRFMEKEWKWYNSHYLESVSFVMLPEKGNHNKVEAIIGNLANLDYVFLANPSELYSEAEFLKQSEYSVRLVEDIQEQKKELFIRLLEVRDSLDTVQAKGIKVVCGPNLFISLILSAIQGAINSNDLEFLKKISVPKNKMFNYERFLEAVKTKNKKVLIEILKLKEMEYRLY